MAETGNILTPERIAELRAMLADGRRRQKLDAMEEAALAHRAAVPLVADLAALLVSEDYVPCHEQRYDFSGHAPLASSAMRAIEAIGTAPEIGTLRRLLDDHRLIVVPEACYDQGAYIGDYASETLAPSGLAARLVPLLRADGFQLLPELARNARHEQDLIGDPARRAIARLAAFLAAASPAMIAAFQATAEAMAALPEATVPTTSRGFALRDLAALCLKRLAALEP